MGARSPDEIRGRPDEAWRPSLRICTSNDGPEIEIHEASGDALSSRFDTLIEFEQLSAGEVALAVERLVDDRLTQMSADERTYVDRTQPLNWLLPLTDDSGNVRQLGKTIDTVISLLLVRSALEESAARTTASRFEPRSVRRVEPGPLEVGSAPTQGLANNQGAPQRADVTEDPACLHEVGEPHPCCPEGSPWAPAT